MRRARRRGAHRSGHPAPRIASIGRHLWVERVLFDRSESEIVRRTEATRWQRYCSSTTHWVRPRACTPSRTSCARPATPCTRPTCSRGGPSTRSRRASRTPARSAGARSWRAASARPRRCRTSSSMRACRSESCPRRSSRRPAPAREGALFLYSCLPASEFGAWPAGVPRRSTGRTPTRSSWTRATSMPPASSSPQPTTPSSSSTPATSTTSPTPACRATTRARQAAHAARARVPRANRLTRGSGSDR